MPTVDEDLFQGTALRRADLRQLQTITEKAITMLIFTPVLWNRKDIAMDIDLKIYDKVFLFA